MNAALRVLRALRPIVFVTGVIAPFERDSCRADFLVNLPAIGAAVDYRFNPPERILVVADGVAPAEAFVGRASFADGKRIWRRLDPSQGFLAVDLIIRGRGLRDALLDMNDPTVGSQYDKTLTLLGEDEMPLETATNSGTSYDDAGDWYSYSWGFFTPGDLKITGFLWNASPDVLPGQRLPEILAVEVTLWGSPLVVVPEPSAACLAAIAAHFAARKLRPSF